MNKVILLTGKPRMGKTTAIKKTLQMIGADKCGGFYTEEIRDAANRIGFRCVSVAGDSIEIAHIDSVSPLRVGRYGVMAEAFEQFAIRTVEHSLRHARLTVIDEIGPMQLLSAPFRQLVHRLVSDPPHVVLGTICLDAHPIADKIKKEPAVSVVQIREENRDSIPGTLSDELGRLLR